MVMTMEKAQVSMPSDIEVRVTRSFNAPAKLVYRAYTEPKLMTQWLLGPPGWSMPVCEMDVREGGAYRWRWRNDEDGKEFGFHGIFQKVEPNKKLVHTEFYDPGDVGGDMGDGALITVEFVEKGAITTMISTMDFKTKEARDAAIATGMTDGMEMGYERLDKILPDLA